ncbi:MAG: patatin-like phospholipase family protein [Patescibacteria group bacterium]|nr:patatin-like phospholipase family protein [Patescibacteria group bacterium]
MSKINNTNQKKVGVAVSGGFIRAVASIGVLQVLEENNIPINLISGCSAGSGIAAIYSVGTLKKLYNRLIVGRRRDYWEVIFEPTIPRQGLLKGNRTREFFKEFVGEKKFSDTNIKLFITATDLATLSPVVIEQGLIYEAIQASVGVPGIFIPLKKDGKILVDGGNFNLIPSEALYQNGADYVIAIDTSRPPNPTIRVIALIKKMLKLNGDLPYIDPETDPHVVSLLRRAVSLSSSRIDNFHHSAYRYDVLIRPQLINIQRWQVSKVKEMIESGRQAAEKMIPQIKKDLGL